MPAAENIEECSVDCAILTRQGEIVGKCSELASELGISRQRAWQLLKDVAGQCTQCGKAAIPGRSVCAICKRTNAVDRRTKYRQARGRKTYNCWKYPETSNKG